MGNICNYENISDVSRLYDFEKTEVILSVWGVFIRTQTQRCLIGICSFVFKV